MSTKSYTDLSTHTLKIMGMLLAAYFTKGMGRPNKCMGESPPASPAVMVGYSRQPARARASAVSVLNRFAADQAIKKGIK